MATPITLAQARPLLRRAVASGVTTQDSRIVDRLNEATQRLLSQGLWVGTVAEAIVCTYQQCFALPPEIETLLQFFDADPTLDVYNGWYQIDNPSTYVDPDYLEDLSVIDRGEYPTIYDLNGPKFIKVYSGTTEAGAPTLRVYGKQSPNNNEVFTGTGSTYARGELIAISPGGSLSANIYQQITAIEKPQTASVVTVYAHDPVTGQEDLIATIYPETTIPAYRRYFVPEVNIPSNSFTKLRVKGKRRYVPLVNDTDYLIIPNLAAIKCEMLAIERMEANDMQNSMLLSANALKILQDEVKNYNLDPTNVGQRRAQFQNDMTVYPSNTLGYVRARIALELPMKGKTGFRRLARAINNAEDRIITKGLWKGTVGYQALYVNNGSIAVPPQVETVLTAHLNTHPLIIRNRWFENLQQGPGLATYISGGSFNCIDKGLFPTFFDLPGVPSSILPTPVLPATTISVFSSATEVAGAYVTVFGYDQTGAWIQTTNADGTVSDGIVVPIGTKGVYGTQQFSNITGITKGVTVGTITVEIPAMAAANGNPATPVQIWAVLKPYDLQSQVRRYYIPALFNSTNPEIKTVVCQVKYKHVPLIMPTDQLQVSNYPAMKAMVQAIMAEEDDNFKDAVAIEEIATNILREELNNNQGMTQRMPQMQMRGFGAGRIYQPK